MVESPSQQLHFCKMHALGNDFIIVDESAQEFIKESDKSGLARILCKRHESVGADGILFVVPATLSGADIRIRIFNPDGSEAQMCGNGVRCFVKYVDDKQLVKGKADTYAIQTMAGIRVAEVKCRDESWSVIKVDMGVAEFEPEKVPAKFPGAGHEILERGLVVADGKDAIKLSAVNVGNPHAVILTQNLSMIKEIGPLVENHSAFPERTNVHCMKTSKDKTEYWVSTWERGAGYTLACGTGATACALVGVRLGRLAKDKTLHAHLEGGELDVTVHDTTDGKLRATIEGEAVYAFEGVVKVKLL